MTLSNYILAIFIFVDVTAVVLFENNYGTAKTRRVSFVKSSSERVDTMIEMTGMR